MATTGAEQDRDELWAYGYSYREIEAMDRFDAFEAGVLAGASEARENLKGGGAARRATRAAASP